MSDTELTTGTTGTATGTAGGGHDLSSAAYARTPVPLPSIRADDPHLQPAARNPERWNAVIALSFLLAIAGFVAFGAAYWVNGKPWILATSIGVGLFALGFGLTAWGKYLMPRGPFVEERHDLAGNQEERDAMSAALVQRTGVVVKRRGLIGLLFATGAAVFGIVALFPLIRSLGPLPKTTLRKTNWKPGARLVDANGRPIRVGTLVEGGIVTVFPEGWQDTDEGMAIDQTVLIRYATTNWTTQAGRETWGPQGYLAYSKLCTHLGCPVGLYEKELGLLVCPCHQSMFDVATGCDPVFGPAPRPLPQLPLMVDDQGYLAAQEGYDQPVGPGFWER